MGSSGNGFLKEHFLPAHPSSVHTVAQKNRGETELPDGKSEGQGRAWETDPDCAMSHSMLLCE